MRDSVFSPAFGNRPTHLVGRELVLQDFARSLESVPGSKERATVLLGQRGSGKTVLLWEIADRAEQQGFVVATPTVASEDMLERIVEKIQDNGERFVKERTAHMTGGSVGALGFSAGLQFSREVQESKSFQYKLAHLARTLSSKGHGILILVDELQANSPEVRQLVIAYQELVGEGLDVAIVLAGLPGAIAATLNDKVLTFLNRAQKITLEPLSVTAVDAYFEQAFKQLGLNVSSDIRRKAAQATQGSPYFLQLIGHSIFQFCGMKKTVSEEDLANALYAAQSDFENDVCKTTLAALSDRDIDFLRAMAQDEGPSKMQEIAQRMGATPDYAQKYRKRLIDAGVIEVPVRGKVTFAVPHLADFLRSEEGMLY